MFKSDRHEEHDSDEENDQKEDAGDKSAPCTSKPQMCSCFSSTKKEKHDRFFLGHKSKREMYIHHNGTLLELAAAYGRPEVVELLLDRGAVPYAIYDGTTVLLQALLHWNHTRNVQARNACLRYRKVVILLLEKISVKKYTRLWEQCPVTDKLLP